MCCLYYGVLSLTVTFQTPLKGANAVTPSIKNRKKLREMESASKPMVVSTYASSSADGPTVSKQRKKQIKVHIFFSAWLVTYSKKKQKISNDPKLMQSEQKPRT